MRSLLFFICLVLGATGCQKRPEKGQYTFFYELYDSIPFDSFDENSVADDKKTLREPVRGTIARGDLDFQYGYQKTAQDAERAGIELKNPYPKTAEHLAAGKRLYETMCVVCHGKTGQGDGLVAQKFPKPQPFSSDYMKRLPPGRIYHAITVGSYIMGSYASQLSPQERWQVVHYVETLQRGTP